MIFINNFKIMESFLNVLDLFLTNIDWIRGTDELVPIISNNSNHREFKLIQ